MCMNIRKGREPGNARLAVGYCIYTGDESPHLELSCLRLWVDPNYLLLQSYTHRTRTT